MPFLREIIGFGKISLNWTTGQLFFAVLSFQLLSGGMMRSGIGPWTVSISIPLGAIVFLARRNSLLRSAGPLPVAADGT